MEFWGYIVTIVILFSVAILVNDCTTKDMASNKYYACLEQNKQLSFKERKEMCTLPERK